MMIQSLTAMDKSQNFGQVSEEAARKAKSTQVHLNDGQKIDEKAKSVFQQAAYVVEFSNQANQMIEKSETQQKVRALGAYGSHAATIDAALEDTINYLNETEGNLAEMEVFAQFAADDTLKLTIGDRELLQKEVDRIKNEMGLADQLFDKEMNDHIDDLIGEILDAHAQKVADGMPESDLSKDAVEQLTAALNGEKELDWQDKFDLLGRVDGLSDEDREAARVLKEDIMEKIFSSSDEDSSSKRSLESYLKDVYTARVTTVSSAQDALDVIKMAKSEVRSERSTLLYNMRKNSSETADTKSTEQRAEEVARLKKQLENQFKQQVQLFNMAQENR